MPYPEVAFPAQAYRIGYASGFFDLFHIGHLRYLELAAQHCEKLIVGVPSDTIVRADQRPKPFTPCDQRMAIIAALRCVTEVVRVEVSMEQPSAFLPWIKRLGNPAIFVGEDWRDSARWSRLGPLLAEQGVKVHFLPRTDGVSTTWIKQSLAKIQPYDPKYHT